MRANDDVAAADVSVVIGADGSVTTRPILDDYLFLPGRAGGQHARGGDASGGTLTLSANAGPNPANSVITVNGRFTLSMGTLTAANPIALTLQMSGATPTGTPGFIVCGLPSTMPSRITILRAQNAVTKSGGGVPFVMFDVSCRFNFQAVQGAGQVFFYQATYADDGQVRTVGVNSRMFIVTPIFAPLTAGSTGNASTITILELQPTVDASWNPLSLARFIVMQEPGGTHAVGITDYVGIDVADNVTKPTNVFTIRNLEDRAKMVHRGAASFGDLAITVPPAGIALEVRSTIEAFLAPRMSGVQAAALVGVVPDGSQVYVNAAGGGLVIGMHQMLGGAWVAM